MIKDIDVVFLSVLLYAIPKLPADLFAGVPAEVVVADTSNYYPDPNNRIPSLTFDLGPSGIRVNTVTPSLTISPEQAATGQFNRWIDLTRER